MTDAEFKNKAFYKPHEIAEALDLSITYIIQCLNNGQISGNRFGRVWRVAAKECRRIAREGIAPKGAARA